MYQNTNQNFVTKPYYINEIEEQLINFHKDADSYNFKKSIQIQNFLSNLKDLAKQFGSGTLDYVVYAIESFYSENLRTLLESERDIKVKSDEPAYLLRLYLITSPAEQLIYLNEILKTSIIEFHAGMDTFKTNYIHKNDIYRADLIARTIKLHSVERYGKSPRKIIEQVPDLESFIYFWQETWKRDLQSSIEEINKVAHADNITRYNTINPAKGQTSIFDFKMK